MTYFSSAGTPFLGEPSGFITTIVQSPAQASRRNARVPGPLIVAI
ncbi:MAG: hypothetical protein WCG47_23115 [Dermatophilaceae bacterium]